MLTCQRVLQPDKEAFKPANPGKMSTGPGTFHGLFGGKIEYIEDGVYSRPKKFGGAVHCLFQRSIATVSPYHHEP